MSEYAVVQGLDPPSRRQQGELAEDNAPGASGLTISPISVSTSFRSFSAAASIPT